MRALGLLLLSLGTLAFLACAHTASTEEMSAVVAKRAAFDLDCGENELNIVELTPPQKMPSQWVDVAYTRGVYGAKGCGQRASYVVECANEKCQPIMNSDSEKEPER